jgi:uncharacterized glyoxalase superfamily protein PhnB
MMKKVVAKNEKELMEYRQRLFEAKESYRKEQADLPFEKKIAIVMQLHRFAREWRQP